MSMDEKRPVWKREKSTGQKGVKYFLYLTDDYGTRWKIIDTKKATLG
jgi:hypothetical protein